MTTVVEEPGGIVVVKEVPAAEVIHVNSPGPKGDKGDVGDVNPDMPIILAAAEDARDAAQIAAAEAAGEVVSVQAELDAHIGSGGASHAAAVAGGDAGFMTGADKTKLNGVAAGATANSSDATLLARANHTGTQLASTISDFDSATGLPDVTGRPLHLLRVKADESGYETRTPTEARSDISAAENSPGLIGYFPFSSAPTGWLKANGALVSRTTYAALFAAANADGLVSEATWAATSWGRFGDGDGSTTFRLPDLRGEVLRGWDDSRGVDSGRARGTSQLDAFQGHKFQYLTAQAGASATIYPVIVGPFNAGTYVDRSPDGSLIITDGVNGTPRTAAETRARNVSSLACVKF